ncbi:hypothetical protein KUCAC02_025726, partial [Chaenocephalus aceratus]
SQPVAAEETRDASNATNVPPNVTTEEWEEIKEACDVLKPFEEVTVEVSCESYVTASKGYTPSKGPPKNNLQSPHRKVDKASDEAFQRISNAAGKVNVNEQAEEEEHEAEQAGSTSRESAVWAEFDQRVSGQLINTRNSTAEAIMEVRSFFEEAM